MRLLAILVIKFLLPITVFAWQPVLAIPGAAEPVIRDQDAIRIIRADGQRAPVLEIIIDGMIVGMLSASQSALLTGPLSLHDVALQLSQDGRKTVLTSAAKSWKGTRQFVVSVRDRTIHVNERRTNARNRPANIVLTFDDEGEDWVDISQPPAGSIWRRTGIPETGTQWKAAGHWSIRMMYVAGQALYEFDRQGNILRIDGELAPNDTYVAEEYYRGKPAWVPTKLFQVIHDGKPRRGKVLVASAFVMTSKGNVCPAQPIAEIYREINEIGTSIFSSQCDRAGPWSKARPRMLTYPFFVRGADKPRLMWAVEYFREPVRALVDGDGNASMRAAGNSTRA